MKSPILALFVRFRRLSDTLACTGPLILQKLWDYHPQTLYTCSVRLLHSPIHTYCTGLSASVPLESFHPAFGLWAWRKKPSWWVIDMVEEFSSPFPQKYSKTDDHYAFLLEDARRYLQMGFEPMKCWGVDNNDLEWPRLFADLYLYLISGPIIKSSCCSCNKNSWVLPVNPAL